MHNCTLMSNPTNDIYRGCFAHIISIWLKCQSKNANRATTERTKNICQLRNNETALIMVDIHNGVEHLRMQPCLVGHISECAYIFGKTIMTDQSRRRNQGSRTGLHTIDGRFNIFLLNLPNGKRRKGSMPLITVRLNMTLIACQHTFDLCTTLLTKDIREHSYLLAATYSQDIRFLF